MSGRDVDRDGEPEPSRASNGPVSDPTRGSNAAEPSRGSDAPVEPGHNWPGSDRPGSVPLAYLITFTTYGAWLHGDPRGSVDREHKVPGTPYLDPNAPRASWEQQQARQEPTTLDAAARGVARAAIIEVCEYRDWTLHALNVRTNHVHAVVTAPAPPEQILHDFKAHATRGLRRSGRAAPKAKAWTTGGSTRYLWTPEALSAACRYVDDGQGPEI